MLLLNSTVSWKSFPRQFKVFQVEIHCLLFFMIEICFSISTDFFKRMTLLLSSVYLCPFLSQWKWILCVLKSDCNAWTINLMFTQFPYFLDFLNFALPWSGTHWLQYSFPEEASKKRTLVLHRIECKPIGFLFDQLPIWIRISTRTLRMVKLE